MKRILNGLDFCVPPKEINAMRGAVKDFTEGLRHLLIKNKIDAEVFVGGSFAKGTLTLEKKYDVDIFVRFDWRYENLSDLLEKVLKKLSMHSNLRLKRVHGSRDYFILENDTNFFFEVIPCLKIKTVRQAQNVTDLSYFHVKYVRKNFKESMKKELALAKQFCKAQHFYGAESYVNGFSGYGLECLIIYFKTFEKMLQGLAKIKIGERMVIDVGSLYKKKEDAFFTMNESRLRGPIVLIDPIFKERNVLAALNLETFLKFQKKAQEFIAKPSVDFFVPVIVDKKSLANEAKKKSAEVLHLQLFTNRQEGDIAGTKMKKFYVFLTKQLERYFELSQHEFQYSGEGDNSSAFFVVRAKKAVVKIGPLLKMKEAVARFKEKNKNIFVRNGVVHSKIKIDFSADIFVKNFLKDNKEKLKEMSISDVKIIY